MHAITSILILTRSKTTPPFLNTLARVVEISPAYLKEICEPCVRYIVLNILTNGPLATFRRSSSSSPQGLSESCRRWLVLGRIFPLSRRQWGLKWRNLSRVTSSGCRVSCALTGFPATLMLKSCESRACCERTSSCVFSPETSIVEFNRPPHQGVSSLLNPVPRSIDGVAGAEHRRVVSIHVQGAVHSLQRRDERCRP